MTTVLEPLGAYRPISEIGSPETYGMIESEYLQFDRTFGTVDPEELLDIAYRIEAAQTTLPHAHRVAASALVEAAVWYPDGDKGLIDTRLDLIDCAEEHLRLAIDGCRDELEQGKRHPNDQTDWLKPQVDLQFLRVYRDLVCGELTQDTREELRVSLGKTIRYTKGLIDISLNDSIQRQDLVGYFNELIALYAVLTSNSQFIGVPATPRADNGRGGRLNTHDVALLEIAADSDGDRVIGVQNREVKRKKSLQHAGDYIGSEVVSMNFKAGGNDIKLFTNDHPGTQRKRARSLRKRASDMLAS